MGEVQEVLPLISAWMLRGADQDAAWRWVQRVNATTGWVIEGSAPDHRRVVHLSEPQLEQVFWLASFGWEGKSEW